MHTSNVDMYISVLRQHIRPEIFSALGITYAWSGLLALVQRRAKQTYIHIHLLLWRFILDEGCHDISRVKFCIKIFGRHGGGSGYVHTCTIH